MSKIPDSVMPPRQAGGQPSFHRVPREVTSHMSSLPVGHAPPSRPADWAAPMQMPTAPFGGTADFSPLQQDGFGVSAALDSVSVGDLLRNAFVYPPHTVYRDVRIASHGFRPEQDLHTAPHFHFPWQSASFQPRPSIDAADTDALVSTYHRLLCEAVSRSASGMRSPWLLQSGGKDSTSLAIAVADAAPSTTCITYAGGGQEDELESAQGVARRLGLRHVSLVCDPGRAYDRYLELLPRMPLLTADFALLSYCDLVTHMRAAGGDGLLDGLGSDIYFGLPMPWRGRVLLGLARGLPLPPALFGVPVVRGSFVLSYLLGTVQMRGFERLFPGSRFTDNEVDALFGHPVAARSRQRAQLFEADLAAAGTMEAKRRIAVTVSEPSHFGKGMYSAAAAGLRLGYPYCDEALRDWVLRAVPDELLIGRDNINKVLVRRHISRRFERLPYVSAKGSFRFDICGLARQRFEQVYAFAVQNRDVLPGASPWLERHRTQLDNKYFASKFYLLAVTLPWLLSRAGSNDTPAHAR